MHVKFAKCKLISQQLYVSDYSAVLASRKRYERIFRITHRKVIKRKNAMKKEKLKKE